MWHRHKVKKTLQNNILWQFSQMLRWQLDQLHHAWMHPEDNYVALTAKHIKQTSAAIEVSCSNVQPLCAGSHTMFLRSVCLRKTSCAAAVWGASYGPSRHSSSSSCSGNSPVCHSSSAPGIFQPAAAFSSQLNKNKKSLSPPCLTVAMH